MMFPKSELCFNNCNHLEPRTSVKSCFRGNLSSMADLRGNYALALQRAGKLSRATKLADPKQSFLPEDHAFLSFPLFYSILLIESCAG